MAKQLTAKQIADLAISMELPNLSDMLPMVAGLDLTPERRRILATKCLPQAATWNQTQKAAYAGVTTRTWYNAEKNAQFKQIACDFIKARIGEDIPEIWAVYVAGAKLPDGYRQAERILQQVGILEKDKSIVPNVTVNVAVIEEKRKTSTETMLNRFGYTVNSDN